MTTATRNWFPSPDGGLVLELAVVVNEEKFVVRSTTCGAEYRYMAPPPFRHVEQELRRKLMRSVEDRLLGPSP